MPVPEIMIVAPPRIIEPKSSIAHKFQGTEKRCVGLPDELNKIAIEQSTLYFDSGNVTEASKVDGIHLDENQHSLLGVAIATAVFESEIF